MAAAEAIDEDGSATGPCGGSRECKQVGGEIFRIIGERIQIFASDHYGRSVVGGVGRDSVFWTLVDVEFLIGELDGEFQRDVGNWRSGGERHFQGFHEQQLRC